MLATARTRHDAGLLHDQAQLFVLRSERLRHQPLRRLRRHYELRLQRRYSLSGPSASLGHNRRLLCEGKMRRRRLQVSRPGLQRHYRDVHLRSRWLGRQSVLHGSEFLLQCSILRQHLRNQCD